MADYQYQQNVFEGESYGYVKYNITPDFGTPIASGELVTITGKLYCRSMAVKSLEVQTSVTGAYRSTVFNVSASKATATAFSISLPMWALSSLWGSNRLVSAPISFTFWSGANGGGDGIQTMGSAEQSISYLRYRIVVAVEGLAFERCSLVDGVYQSSDEGTSVRGALKISLSDEYTIADITVAKVRVTSASGLNQTFSLPSSVLTAALSESGYSEAAPSLFEGIEFDTAFNYTLTFILGDTYNTYSPSALVARAFANVHMSGCKKGGVAFGKFSSATDEEPMFECEYPAYFSRGIQITQGGVEEQTLAFDADAPFVVRADNPLQPTLRRFGHVMELHGEIQPTQSIDGGTTYYPICTLPAAYAPHHDVVVLQQGSNQSIWMLRIFKRDHLEHPCKVMFARYRSGSSWASATTTAWLPFHATWIV